jgi:hypothetical protein
MWKFLMNSSDVLRSCFTASDLAISYASSTGLLKDLLAN